MNGIGDLEIGDVETGDLGEVLGGGFNAVQLLAH